MPQANRQNKLYALETDWVLSDGQPWLVNALAHEVTYEIKELRDPTQKITESHMQAAGQNLITRRETHLDRTRRLF